jgi:hypothetical protein
MLFVTDIERGPKGIEDCLRFTVYCLPLAGTTTRRSLLTAHSFFGKVQKFKSSKVHYSCFWISCRKGMKTVYGLQFTVYRWRVRPLVGRCSQLIASLEKFKSSKVQKFITHVFGFLAAIAMSYES